MIVPCSRLSGGLVLAQIYQVTLSGRRGWANRGLPTVECVADLLLRVLNDSLGAP